MIILITALVQLITCALVFLLGRRTGELKAAERHDRYYARISNQDLEAERMRASADRKALDDARKALAALDPGTELAKGEAMLDAVCPGCGGIGALRTPATSARPEGVFVCKTCFGSGTPR
jgi:hypothetical protein